MTSALRPIVQVVKDLFHLPTVSRNVFPVWRRHFDEFKKAPGLAFFWLLFEPVIFLLGIGYGVGELVGPIQGQPYAEFFAPAIMAISGMMVSFHETSHICLNKLQDSKAFQNMLLSPIRVGEIAVGEVLWGTTKGFMSVLGIAAIEWGLNLFHGPLTIAVLGVQLLNCWVFATFGLLIASYARQSKWFIYLQSGLMTPMILFCGTYFPLQNLPDSLQKLALVLPLTHTVLATRLLLKGNFAPLFFVNIGVLLTLGLLLSNWSCVSFERRLKAN